VRPDVVVVQFVASAAVAGTYSYQPFASTNVMQYNTNTDFIAPAVGPPIVVGRPITYGSPGDYVSSIYITWAGTQVPLRPILASSVNDTGESYAAYLAAASGGVFGEKTPMLSPSGFKAGRQIFCFQLNPDGARAGSSAMNLSDRGSLEVHAVISRSAVFTEDTTVLVAGFHAASVEIDSAMGILKEGMG